MRITFCLQTANRSGGVKVVAQYADRLVRRGHDVTVVSGPVPAPTLRQRLRQTARSLASGRRPPRYEVFPPSALDGMPHVRHHRVAESRPFVDDDFPDADVVVATWWETAEQVARLSPRKGAKAYFVQGLESTIDGMPAARVEATLDLPLHPIVVARFLVDHLRVVHGRKDEISYVPNAVDGTLFDAPPRGKRPRPTIACIHTGASHVKGFDVTRAALLEVALRAPEVHVLCFGTPPAPSGPLPSSFEYVRDPAQTEIPKLYARADVFAHGSRVEGFGLPILEAMACRTPVVATPAGAAPELLAEGRGRMIARVDPNAMAHAILDVLGLSDDAWRALSDRAHAHAHAYGLEEATERMEAALVLATRRA
ncbi:MAG: glycosyltransferase family 4 protein [Sandaracinaceae bacterium]